VIVANFQDFSKTFMIYVFSTTFPGVETTISKFHDFSRFSTTVRTLVITTHLKFKSVNVAHRPEMPHVVEAARSVRGAHHLQAEGGLQVPDLQQHQGQVLDEQQRVHQRGGVAHDAPVVRLPGLQHPHAVEQPIGRHEEEHQRQQQAAEDEEARQRGPRRPQEQRPRGDEEDQQLEGQRDVQALARRAARLQRVPPQELRQRQEGERRDEGEEAEDGAQRRAEVSPAVRRRRVLEVLGQPRQVLVGGAVHRGAGDHRGGLAPVVILERERGALERRGAAPEDHRAVRTLTLSSPRVDSASSSGSPGAWIITDLSPRMLLSRLLARCRSFLSLEEEEEEEGLVSMDGCFICNV